VNKRLICVVVLFLACFSSIASSQNVMRETTDKDIDVAISALKSYLWSNQYKDGGWPLSPRYCHSHMLTPGFGTAITIFALLESGESYENNEKMKKAIDVLCRLDLRNDLKCRALRVSALSRTIGVDKKSPYQQILKQDIEWLLKGRGVWGEKGPEKYGDNTCNHFALMALWDASLAGMEIKKNIFLESEKVWTSRQNKDGGWAITGLEKLRSRSTVQMTAAALASMYACRDAASFSSGRYAYEKNIDDGWKFMDSNLTEEELTSHVYTEFSVQQAGMASGDKFIGGLDWYAIIADKLAQPRTSFADYDSTQWGHIVTPAYELIILSRGRLPLTFNKLDYGAGTGWDFHPRDIARFTEYMDTNFERPMRWQIVSLKDNIRTLLDSPIMMISGEDAMNINEAQWKMLVDYSLSGGTLLFVPVKKGVKFLESVKKKLNESFAAVKAESETSNYALRALPSDDPLYSMYKEIPGGDRLMKLSALSDGTRYLAVVCERDIAQSWQRKQILSGKKDYLMGVNFFLYATGMNSLSSRMRPVFVRTSEKPININIQVGWLKHKGNWNTQPFALNYLHDKLVAENSVGLSIEKGLPIDADKFKGKQLLWMTGTKSFQLNGHEILALRKFMKNGGVLFVNAVGGSAEFDESVRAMFEEIFRDDTDVIQSFADLDSPLRTGKMGEYRGPKIEKSQRTYAFRKAVPQTPDPLWVYMDKKNRVMAVYVKYGVHDTMDGHTGYGAISYMPSDSLDIAANVALYSLVYGMSFK